MKKYGTKNDVIELALKTLTINHKSLNFKIVWEIIKFIQIKAYVYSELIHCYINLKKIKATYNTLDWLTELWSTFRL